MKLLRNKFHAMTNQDQDTSPPFVKVSSSAMTEKEAKQKSHINIIKDPIKKEESILAKQKVPDQKTQNQQPIIRKPQEEGLYRTTPQRRYPTLKYQTIFLGICYSCKNYGHNAMNYKAYGRNRSNIGKYSRNV